MNVPLLKVDNLSVSIDGKQILKDINLEIPQGEVHILFGPNGSGKSTLLHAIMGLPGYEVRGKIYFHGTDITNMPPEQRARLGIGIAFQRPPIIRGVKLGKLLELINSNKPDIQRMAEELQLTPHLQRELHYGFSGGETKRVEILLLIAQKPDLLLLDEPESGVDLENIDLIANKLRHLLEKEKRISERHRSALIITHTGYILNYLNAAKGYVMVDGRIKCSGPPRDIWETIRKVGYSLCEECLLQRINEKRR